LAIETVPLEVRISKMNKVNPKYVLRNYMTQMAIDEAHKGNYTIFEQLYELIKKPYEEQPEMSQWFALRPSWAINKVGCSMLSCSS
jgi:serine/tyrosine/threonine adenylyltransferase